VLGFAAVFFRKFVFAKKQIAVDEIIQSNAKKLGYTFEELISYLQIHHLVSAALWLLILWVLVLFWRGSKKIYLYILLLLLAYFIQGIYFFGWRFITHELTLFDWSVFILFSLSLLTGGIIQMFFIKSNDQEENII
jgi:heme A synthase